jgi:hypothetical protein
MVAQHRKGIPNGLNGGLAKTLNPVGVNSRPFPSLPPRPPSRIPFRDHPATLRTALTSSMAFNNSSNVNASGSTFWDIGRNQINFNISYPNSGGTQQDYSSLTGSSAA